MPVSISLPKGYLLLEIVQPKEGLFSNQGDLIYAEIIGINQLSENFKIGGLVIFRIRDSNIIVLNDDTSYLIKEEKIILNEL
jgi:hypothetical protein